MKKLIETLMELEGEEFIVVDDGNRDKLLGEVVVNTRYNRKAMAAVVDAIDDLQQQNIEQDKYLVILKVSHCFGSWLFDKENRKYALAAAGILVNFFGWLYFIVRG